MDRNISKLYQNAEIKQKMKETVKRTENNWF